MSTAFENILAFHASPALLGIKSANLISVSLAQFPDFKEEVEKFNTELGRSMNLYVLSMDEKRALILIYKTEKLKEAIFERKAYRYLLKHGYPDAQDVNLYLETLKERIGNKTFPHEIGVFLGYDLYDTVAFERGDKECIYVGYWSVYRDKEKKIEIFERYTKCRNIIQSLLSKGYHLSNLIA